MVRIPLTVDRTEGRHGGWESKVESRKYEKDRDGQHDRGSTGVLVDGGEKTHVSTMEELLRRDEKDRPWFWTLGDRGRDD